MIAFGIAYTSTKKKQGKKPDTLIHEILSGMLKTITECDGEPTQHCQSQFT